PVDLAVVVGHQRVRTLSRLLLDPLELLDRALAGLVEQALLDIARQRDREDTEVALLVELDRRMARRAGRLLVRSEQPVLERRDERPLLDALFALDLLDCLNDLLAHVPYPSSIRLPRTIASYGISTGSAPAAAILNVCAPASTSS